MIHFLFVLIISSHDRNASKILELLELSTCLTAFTTENKNFLPSASALTTKIGQNVLNCCNHIQKEFSTALTTQNDQFSIFVLNTSSHNQNGFRSNFFYKKEKRASKLIQYFKKYIKFVVYEGQ